MTVVKEVEILTKALNLLKTKGWTQGANARLSDGRGAHPWNEGAVCYCSMGAAAFVGGNYGNSESARDVLDRVAKARGFVSYVMYNDDVRCEFKHVRALFGKAIIQATFDYVVNHVLSQEKASMNGDQCAYVAKDGGSCAVGCLLPRELARELDLIEEKVPDTYGAAWTRVVETAWAPALEATRLLKRIPNGLLRDLQDWHDRPSHLNRTPGDKERMKTEARHIAKKWSLTCLV